MNLKEHTFINYHSSCTAEYCYEKKFQLKFYTIMEMHYAGGGMQVGKNRVMNLLSRINVTKYGVLIKHVFSTQLCLSIVLSW